MPDRDTNARDAHAFGGKPPAELDIVEHWVNPNRTSPRVGTVSVRLRKFIHHECSVTRTKYGFFVHLPSMPMVDRDGHVLKEESGKWKYKPAVTAIDKAAGNAFSDAVIAIIRDHWPEMLAAEPTPSPRRQPASPYSPHQPRHDTGPLPEDSVDDLWRDEEGRQ